VLTPRDSGSGMPTGKRQHKPVTFVKEWGAASPDLMKIKPQYDVKTIKSARVAADGWTEVALSNADGLCPATQAAAAAIVKSKSNITNN
jgi:type VI secretion system secreted protein Hcp